jgi:hypothetical protein
VVCSPQIGTNTQIAVRAWQKSITKGQRQIQCKGKNVADLPVASPQLSKAEDDAVRS